MKIPYFGEACLQSDGTWAFFIGNATVVAKLQMNAVGKTFPRLLRGDIVQCGEWRDLTRDELEDLLPRVQKMVDVIERRLKRED